MNLFSDYGVKLAGGETKISVHVHVESDVDVTLHFMDDKLGPQPAGLEPTRASSGLVPEQRVNGPHWGGDWQLKGKGLLFLRISNHFSTFSSKSLMVCIRGDGAQLP